MTKRIFCLALCLFLLASMATPVLAAKEEEAPAPVTPVITTLFIGSEESFLSFAENCRLDAYSQDLQVELLQDLDLTGFEFSGVPIFCGTFLGNNHTISGVNITSAGSAVGLFRYLGTDAVVQDLTVTGTIAPQGSQSLAGGIAGSNSGRIENCIFQGTVAGGDQIGGIAGSNTVTGIIDNCRTEGLVHGSHFIGGIAGSNTGVIRKCLNKANVNITPQQNDVAISDITIESMTNSEAANTVTDIGGISGSNGGVIRDCDNFADIGYRHMGYNIGGITGSTMGYVVQSQNFGNVSGRKEVGGIAGQMEPVTQIVFTTDTLQILQGQLDAMGALAGQASANLDSAGAAITGQVAAMQDNIQTATDAVQVLLPGGSNDLDSIQAATNALSSSFQGLQSNMQSISSASQGAITALSGDLKALMGQISAMGATLRGAPQNLGGSVVDVSDNDTPENITGKIAQCANYGAILADLNAGGIAGAISPENDLDPEDDLEITGQTSLNFDSELRAVVLDSENRADVTVTKQNGGGIVGNMALGLVRKCLNTGRLLGSGADYVGGIAGQSDGYLRGNSANCSISGAAYVGGIAGLGKIVTDSRSMVRLSSTEKAGAVLGFSEDRSTVVGNFYMTLEHDPGAIDGISYVGCAQPMKPEAFLALTGLHSIFRQITVTFVFPDGTKETVQLYPGETLGQEDIPAIPEKPGYNAQWDGLDSQEILFDTVFTATYTPYITVLASPECRSDGRPIALCEGSFPPAQSIQVQDLYLRVPPTTEPISDIFSLTLPESLTPMSLRILPAEGSTPNLVLVQDSSGTWQEVPSQYIGSYLVFSVEDDTCAVVLAEDTPFPWHWVALPFALIALGIATFVFIRKKKRS